MSIMHMVLHSAAVGQENNHRQMADILKHHLPLVSCACQIVIQLGI